MYTFIDVSRSQAGMDIRAATVDGVIVKASGANDGLYVAGGYAQHVANGRAVFGNVGHYFFNGPGDARGHADYFVDHLDGWREGDALFLDVENEGTMPAYTPDQAYTFIVRVKERLGVVPALYMSASVVRGQDWSRHVAFGARLWVASYGPNNGQPGSAPSIGSQWAEWSLWQYTSLGKVPGWGGGVDLNLSKYAMKELHIMSMEDQMRQWAAANQAPADAATWDQMCGSQTFRFNSWRGWVTPPRRDISSAYRAGSNSGPLNTDITRAPVGAFHFFDIAGPGNGHVMQDARGGGLVCLSTGYALSEVLGRALGFQSVPGYIAAKGARYMGWATNYAGGTIVAAGTAGGGGYTPIEEDDMTPDQIAALDQARNNAIEANTNAAEARRMLGVILGYNPAANDTERTAIDKLWDDGEDDRENRRMLGVLLGWNAPATDAEAAALEALRAVPDLDEVAIAAAIAEHLPAGVDPVALAASVSQGVLTAFKAQWAK